MATSTPRPLSTRQRTLVLDADQLILRLARHWLLIFNLIWIVYVGLPWLAPIFMSLGWVTAANVIYAVYSTQCHQLPERSYFLFGSQPMYSLAQIQAVWQTTTNPLILRQFVGNTAMGWKVAWSDRMVSMYGGIVLGGVLFSLVRRWLKPLPLWVFILSCVPMGLDGGTHFLSDLFGIGAGFRDSNAWLANLTGHWFPVWFYVGDSLGSFNSGMRILTGLIFGLGAVWLALPYLEQSLSETVNDLEAKLQRAGVIG